MYAEFFGDVHGRWNETHRNFDFVDVERLEGRDVDLEQVDSRVCSFYDSHSTSICREKWTAYLAQ